MTTKREEPFIIVTATEFKTNFGKYLEMISREDIFITRNGKTIAKVINPQISAGDSLRGMLEDCLMATYAKSIHCDYIVTRNKKDFEEFDILLLTPSELLQKIS